MLRRTFIEGEQSLPSLPLEMRERDAMMLKIAGSINELCEIVHRMAVDKGWWQGERNDGELIALIHSELSEALEGLRHGNGPSGHIPEFNAAEEEMADAVIRIADMCHVRGWRLGEAIMAKIRFNATREHRHGGKKF